MGAVDWNKKEELVAEQALKHLKVHFCITIIIWISKKLSEIRLIDIDGFIWARHHDFPLPWFCHRTTRHSWEHFVPLQSLKWHSCFVSRTFVTIIWISWRCSKRLFFFSIKVSQTWIIIISWTWWMSERMRMRRGRLKFINSVFLFVYFSIADVVSEEIIMKWYKESHSSKGKSVFLEQMKKFIEWLQNAEEGTL